MQVVHARNEQGPQSGPCSSGVQCCFSRRSAATLMCFIAPGAADLLRFVVDAVQCVLRFAWIASRAYASALKVRWPSGDSLRCRAFNAAQAARPAQRAFFLGAAHTGRVRTSARQGERCCPCIGWSKSRVKFRYSPSRNARACADKASRTSAGASRRLSRTSLFTLSSRQFGQK